MQISINLDTTANTLSVTVDGTNHHIPLPSPTPTSTPSPTSTPTLTVSCDASHVSTSPSPTHSVSCDQVAGPPSTPTSPITIMTWNVDNWSLKKNHVKSIQPSDCATYAKLVINMLHSIDGNIPSLLGLNEYGVAFTTDGQFTSDTALADYPADGIHEWLNNGKKADYWAPGGFSNNSSYVNDIPSKVLHDTLWLWGTEATIAKSKSRGIELLHYYDRADGSLNTPSGLKESDIKTPIPEFAHVLELTISGKKVAWANAHLFPKSSRADYPYNKDVVNYMCLQNLMHVLRNYDHVIISGDLNWDNKRFMLTYPEAAALNNPTYYPTIAESGGEANRYMYAGAGILGYVSADYALLGYGMAGVKRGDNGATDIDRLNTVDSILVKGFRITKVRKLLSADWFDTTHRPVWAHLEML